MNMTIADDDIYWLKEPDFLGGKFGSPILGQIGRNQAQN